MHALCGKNFDFFWRKKLVVILIVWTAKMNRVTENFEAKIELPILIVRENEYEVNSYVMTYYKYQKIWIPKKSELLQAEMESKNLVDKSAMMIDWDETILLVICQREKQGDFQRLFFIPSSLKQRLLSWNFRLWSWKWIELKPSVHITFLWSERLNRHLSNEFCKHNWLYSSHTWYSFLNEPLNLFFHLSSHSFNAWNVSDCSSSSRNKMQHPSICRQVLLKGIQKSFLASFIEIFGSFTSHPLSFLSSSVFL